MSLKRKQHTRLRRNAYALVGVVFVVAGLISFIIDTEFEIFQVASGVVLGCAGAFLLLVSRVFSQIEKGAPRSLRTTAYVYTSVLSGFFVVGLVLAVVSEWHAIGWEEFAAMAFLGAYSLGLLAALVFIVLVLPAWWICHALSKRRSGAQLN